MKYYKWQEIHKKHHATGKMKSPEDINFAIDDLSEDQKTAWQELQKYWRPAGLIKLLTLAKSYDKTTDTFRPCTGQPAPGEPRTK